MPFPANVDGSSFDTASLIRRFSVFASLSEAEVKVLRGLSDARRHSSQEDLCAVGLPSPPRLVIAGWACRYRLLADRRRQIFGILLPGDFVGRMLLPDLPSQCAVAALTELRTVSAQSLADASATSTHAGLARAVHLMAYLDDRLLFNHMVRLSQQTARGRVAHLMLELHERLGWVGLVRDDRFAMPLTLPVLGDTLGLSVVHVNRTLQQLCADGLLDVGDGMVALLKPERLKEVSEWMPFCLTLAFRQ